MIEEQAEVVSVADGYAWVEARNPSGCDVCRSRQGCGVALFSRLFGQQRIQVRALNTAHAERGEQVIIGIDEGSFLTSALTVYTLPLFSMLTLAIIARLLAKLLAGPSPYVEAASIAAGFLGLILPYVALRHKTGRQTGITANQPVILARIA